MDKRITASGLAAIDQAEVDLGWALQEAVDALFKARSCLSFVPAQHRAFVAEQDNPEGKVFELLESIRSAQDAIVYAKGELLTLEVANG